MKFTRQKDLENGENFIWHWLLKRIFVVKFNVLNCCWFHHSTSKFADLVNGDIIRDFCRLMVRRWLFNTSIFCRRVQYQISAGSTIEIKNQQKNMIKDFCRLMVIGAWVATLVLTSPQAIIFRWPSNNHLDLMLSTYLKLILNHYLKLTSNCHIKLMLNHYLKLNSNHYLKLTWNHFPKLIPLCLSHTNYLSNI